MSILDNFSPKKIVQQAVNTLKEAPQQAVEAAHAVAHAGETGLHAAEKGVQMIKDAPMAAAQGAKSALFNLLPDNVAGTPHLPDYTRLDPAALAAARTRGAGETVAQRTIRDEHGHGHEPVNLIMSGTQAEVEQAFKKAGWFKADEVTARTGLKTVATLADKITGLDKIVDYNYKSAPVSNMFLDGKRHVMAFEKNNDNNHARDHLRVFDSGKTDAQGRPVWEVAATRDTSFALNLKNGDGHHVVDHAIDHERDMAMADLLHGGEVSGWKAAKGVLGKVDAEVVKSRGYQTDGQVYLVDLKAHPDLAVATPKSNLIRDAIQHSPDFVKEPVGELAQKMGKFFEKLN